MKKKITITIPGRPITKKNSQRLMVVGGRPMVCPSKQYKDYEAAAEQYLPDIEAIDCPVNVKCIYYMPTRHRVDLVNLQQATMDLLAHHNILVDDNCRVVVSTNNSKVLYDKENPRAEITITPANPRDIQDWGQSNDSM